MTAALLFLTSSVAAPPSRIPQTAYPIVFFGVRDGCVDMLEVPAHEQTQARLKLLTFTLLGILTVSAVFITDLGLINAVGGGLVASMIVFVFPTIMFAAAINQGLGGNSKNARNEVHLSYTLTTFGVLIGLLGAWKAIENALSLS